MARGLFDLTGKVCVVTGGNRGIGFGMAEGLAEAGASIAIWGSNAARNAEALPKLQGVGGRVIAQTVDVSDEAQVVAGMAAVHEEFGHIDTVIANAGVAYGAPFVELKTEDWRKTMAVNLDGAMWTLREGAKYMVARARAGGPKGSLVGVASSAALTGLAIHQGYSASKAALVMLCKGIAAEYGVDGVRANAVLPGWTATEMTQHARAEENAAFETAILGRMPMHRWGDINEFKGVAVYLASDASSFHTGDALVIDGGYSMVG